MVGKGPLKGWLFVKNILNLHYHISGVFKLAIVSDKGTQLGVAAFHIAGAVIFFN